MATPSEVPRSSAAHPSLHVLLFCRVVPGAMEGSAAATAGLMTALAVNGSGPVETAARSVTDADADAEELSVAKFTPDPSLKRNCSKVLTPCTGGEHSATNEGIIANDERLAEAAHRYGISVIAPR